MLFNDEIFPLLLIKNVNLPTFIMNQLFIYKKIMKNFGGVSFFGGGGRFLEGGI